MDDSWMLGQMDALEALFGPQKPQRIAQYRVALREHAITSAELERGVARCRDTMTRFPTFAELREACRPTRASGPFEAKPLDRIEYLRGLIRSQQWILDRLDEAKAPADDQRATWARAEIDRLEGMIDRAEQFRAAIVCGVPEAQAVREVWGEPRKWLAPIGSMDERRRDAKGCGEW